MPCSFFSLKGIPLSGNFCLLLITFANSLDPDEDQHKVYVGPHLDPNGLTLTLIVFQKEFFEKIDFEKSAEDKTRNYLACKALNTTTNEPFHENLVLIA